MNNNVLIAGANNLAALSTTSVTATSEKPSNPATQLRRQYYSSSWRSVDGITTATLIFDLGAAVSVNYVALAGCRCSKNVIKTVVLSNHADLSIPLATSGAVAAFDLSYGIITSDIYYPPFGLTISHAFNTPQVVRYIGFTLNDPTPRYNYVGASIAVIDNTWQPTVNLEANITTNDAFIGTAPVTKLLRGYTATYKQLKKAETNKLRNMCNIFKDVGRFMFTPRPSISGSLLMETLWCKFVSPIVVLPTDFTDKFDSVQISVMEVDE